MVGSFFIAPELSVGWFFGGPKTGGFIFADGAGFTGSDFTSSCFTDSLGRTSLAFLLGWVAPDDCGFSSIG